MKYAIRLTLMIAILAMGSISYATIKLGADNIQDPGDRSETWTALDQQCIIDYLGMTYGSWSGSTMWPGDTANIHLSGMAFLNSCTPGETLFVYCVDLDHIVNTGPYCVNIDSQVVRPVPYAEQIPSMAYVMTWYPVNTAQQDRIMQLSLWKLSNDERVGSVTYGQPWYTINAGRDPGYPYVNTVYNTDPNINTPANLRVLDALGFGPDSLAKNVIVCGDILTVTAGTTIIDAGMAYVPVTIRLIRGAEAASVNNMSLSGVRIELSIVDGNISDTQVFTDEFGEAHVVISKQAGSPVGAVMQACSYGLWPQKISPCDSAGFQQLLVQKLSTGAVCTLCVTLPFRPDQWEAAELASFDAAPFADGIHLTWRTLSETDLYRWEIERRVSGDSEFSVIAAIPARNLPGGSAYSYTDQAAENGTSYDYRLADVGLNGERTIHGTWVRTATMPANGSTLPLEYELADNFPNPFNPSTTIRFSVPEAAYVNLTVFDVNGREIAVLASRTMEAGTYSVAFNGDNLPSGIYFYTMTSGSFNQTKKMILMK